MRDGCIEQQGSLRHLYRRSQFAFVANFIAESNILDAVLEKNDATFRIKLGDAVIDLPNCDEATREGAIKLSLRPEMFMLKKEGNPTTEQTGIILQSTYIGPVIEYNIETAIGKIFIIATATGIRFQADDQVFLHFHPEELIILPEEN
jgi:iron(III) transport system ATP-binding protein